jgi:hypothetical protein
MRPPTEAAYRRDHHETTILPFLHASFYTRRMAETPSRTLMRWQFVSIIFDLPNGRKQAQDIEATKIGGPPAAEQSLAMVKTRQMSED